MTPEQIAAARALVDAATPGPWVKDDRDLLRTPGKQPRIPLASPWIEGAWEGDDASPESTANAAFIAWCRDGVPALLDALAAAEAERDEMRAAQTYRYIGKDGKPVLARTLEDQRDEMQAQVTDLTAKLEATRDFIADFAAFKFDACYRHPASNPEDEGDDVTDAEPVWAWQEDARAALKAGGA